MTSSALPSGRSRKTTRCHLRRPHRDSHLPEHQSRATPAARGLCPASLYNAHNYNLHSQLHHINKVEVEHTTWARKRDARESTIGIGHTHFRLFGRLDTSNE